MKEYGVKEVASLAKVSVRTLHHYDAIGLLTPFNRSPAGYRLYGEKELLRLQQILFYKELDVPLEAIKKILDDDDFDVERALKEHRKKLIGEGERLAFLINTIDATLQRVQGEKAMLSDEQLYVGFSKEKRERYEREAAEKYSPQEVKEVKTKLQKLPKSEWDAVQDEGKAIAEALAQCKWDKLAVDSEATQALIARHHRWLCNFWQADAKAYKGMGEMYKTNEEFRAYYDAFGKDLADYMCEGMKSYSDKMLAEE